MKNKLILVVLSIILCFSAVTPVYAESVTSLDSKLVVSDQLIEQVYEDTGIDVSNVDVSNFNKEFDFLLNDPVFIELEETLALQSQNVELKEDSVTGQWIPVVAAALRLLISQVGKKGMQKGWKVARPYVQKALKAPQNYIIDGPGSGGRIIQVRSKKTKKPLFRLDYAPIKHGRPAVLHYHVPPNLKDHHVIF